MSSPTMDKDYDYNAGKGASPPSYGGNTYGSNVGAAPMAFEQSSTGIPPRSPASPSDGNDDTNEALLDLAQLEDLQNEAERMKALGNKHMAAQVRILRFWKSIPMSCYFVDLKSHVRFSL